MRYRNEVHVYPAIDTVLQRLVVAIVGYDTEHCFDDWFDESDLQLAGDVDDTGDTVVVDPYGGILDTTKDEDMADLILFILETLQSNGHIKSQLHVVVNDGVIWLSHDYDATEISIEDYMAREVLPHIPDAVAFFEENLGAKKPVIKTGAEIPFTRYFYKYQQPVPSEELEGKFMELELSVSERVAKLFE